MDKQTKKEFEKVGREFEYLARMVKGGFGEVNKRIEELRQEVLTIKADIEDLKLRMGQVAFGFEVKNIERRLRKVELRLKMKQT